MSGLIDTSEKIFRKPWFASITTALGVIVGLIGSLYTPEIKGSFPFAWTLIDGPKITFFWGALLLFGAFFGGIQWAQLRATERTQAHLSQNTLQIKQTVTELITLPPAGFLDLFKEYFVRAENVVRAALHQCDKRSLRKPEAAEAIRIVLNMIVTLALRYHKEPSETRSRYAANIMVFKRVEDIADKASVKQRLLFWENNLNLDAYLGVLDARIELSTTTEMRDSPAPVQDDALRPFAFAIPKVTGDINHREDLQRLDILPGAPYSFLTKRVQIYTDAATLITDAGSYNFTREAINKIRGYFESSQGKQVKSFMTVVLPSPVEDDYPIGILNLHRNQTGLFQDERGVELFAPLIVPFSVILSQILQHYDTLPDESS